MIFRSAARKVHWTGVSILIQLSLSLPCLGQRISGDIIGTISDSSGGAVVNTRLTLRNLDTGRELRTSSTSTGDFTRPNALRPRTRPSHSLIPAFLEKGDLHMGFGIIGGPNQPQDQAQFIANFVDFQMNIQAALDAPRFMSAEGCVVRIEERIPAIVRQQLASRGHRLDVRSDYSYLVGPGQVVLHDSAANVNYGASDPRGDGSAVPGSPAFLPSRGPQ